eukprot:47145-Rhodomonas_salina.1
MLTALSPIGPCPRCPRPTSHVPPYPPSRPALSAVTSRLICRIRRHVPPSRLALSSHVTPWPWSRHSGVGTLCRGLHGPLGSRV